VKNSDDNHAYLSDVSSIIHEFFDSSVLY
jgi:hypothetical protein